MPALPRPLYCLRRPGRPTERPPRAAFLRLFVGPNCVRMITPSLRWRCPVSQACARRGGEGKGLLCVRAETVFGPYRGPCWPPTAPPGLHPRKRLGCGTSKATRGGFCSAEFELDSAPEETRQQGLGCVLCVRVGGVFGPCRPMPVSHGPLAFAQVSGLVSAHRGRIGGFCSAEFELGSALEETRQQVRGARFG